ncbi:MAG: hypothetical protein DME33_01205 [Verrucomicrobia bacterium]|nr:MAG: hypothetical protein DME33_01205 [Verrucomicrobiota bacterium]
MRFCLLLIILLAVALPDKSWAGDAKPASPRAQITVENWDKGAPLSRWAYTHLSEVFPTAVVRRAEPVANLPEQLDPRLAVSS